ncbi:BQ5605_C007g04515 [Microbotryum silenes-dioicae]|uniref:BQ5605_C007g04515 protein n=1 Tax=Microbotryum silenes-dioicae TaxID=796604 RepID=A0A2X0MBD3_9BASI|nr:BQ5605_C007g04515 [Microbotryum silenes-dioicae]
MPTRLYIIAIGGPTCSGKTTLAKHLAQILPNSTSLFQDDFAPPAEKVPIHPVHRVQDWDDPDGAIEWDRQRETLQYIRDHDGAFPEAHYSHDSFNVQIPVPIDEATRARWIEKFTALQKEVGDGKGDNAVKYIIADGFLMLVDEQSVRQFDVRIFVREGYQTLKKRREERNGYHTAVESEPEGALWTDPPGYWDQIVWPAYEKAHKKLFTNGDINKGTIDPSIISGVNLLEASELSMTQLVDQSCEAIYGMVKEGRTARHWERP